MRIVDEKADDQGERAWLGSGVALPVSALARAHGRHQRVRWRGTCQGKSDRTCDPPAPGHEWEGPARGTNGYCSIQPSDG